MKSITETFKLSHFWEEESTKDKYEELMNLMQGIIDYESCKFWRKRFASDQQYAEEYPEDYEKDMAVAWVLIKRRYTEHMIEIDDYIKTVEVSKHHKELLEIIRNYAEEDIDRVLLEDEDEDEG